MVDGNLGLAQHMPNLFENCLRYQKLKPLRSPRIKDLSGRALGIDERAHDHIRIEDDPHHVGRWFSARVVRIAS